MGNEMAKPTSYRERNMKTNYLLFFLALCNYFIYPSEGRNNGIYDNKFILITNLYNEKDDKRIKEYIECLERNLAHPDIHTIHIIYDTSKDAPEDTQNILLNYLKTKKVPLTYIDKRPTYNFCFSIANSLYQDKKIILSNADIYFNQTLHVLVNYDLTNKFLAITRWNVRKDGTLAPHAWPKGNWRTISQDVWIFNSPLRAFENGDIAMGTLHCDGQIAYQASKAHLKLINPCQTIQCCHLHLSEIRDYPVIPYPKGQAIHVPASTLY